MPTNFTLWGNDTVRERVKNGILALSGIALLVLVWVAAFLLVGNELLAPSPLQSARAFFALFADAGFYRALLATLLRTAIAFAGSAVLAAIFAVGAYLFPAFERFFSGIVAVLRSLPTMAVLLMLLVWTTGDVSAVAVGFLGLFPMLYTAFASALLGVDGKLKEVCKVYRVGVKEQIKCLYLPHVLPRVIKEGGAGLSFGWKLTVSAEILASTFQSVGGMMQEAKFTYEYPTLFALTAVVCLLGVLVEWGANALARRAERRLS